MTRSSARLAALLAATALLAACGGGVAPAEEAAVATLQSYLRAVKRERCDEAWRYLSRATRQAIAADRERLRERDPSAAPGAMAGLYCESSGRHQLHAYVPSSAELLEIRGDEARVQVMFRRGGASSWFPGGPPGGFSETPGTWVLVREPEGWRIDLFRPTDRPLVIYR